MGTNIQTWYDFVLQQVAAESYLDQIGINGNDATRVLMSGSNNPTYPQNNNMPLPTDPILLGATRMTATQADDFLTRYRIVSHLPNTATGFSGTLMERLDAQGTGTGEYTFAMRSTEYLNANEGGDWERDGLSGTDGEIL